MHGCGQDEGARQQVKRAAESTLEAGGARLASRGVAPQGDDRVYRFSGTGVVDASGSTDVTTTYAVRFGRPVGDRRGLRSRQIVVDGIPYVTYPGIAKGPGPQGKPWYTFGHLDDPQFYWGTVGAADRSRGPRQAARGGNGGGAAAGPFRDHDREGRPAPAPPRAQPAPDLEFFMRSVRSLPAGELRTDVWVDRRGHLRRFVQRMKVQGFAAFGQTTDYSDVGPQVTISGLRRARPKP